MLTGRVADRNGPWIADRLLELGVELAHITICGDRAADIEAQLRFLAAEGVDLIVTSGGLGPTADDMTVATVARFCERELVLDAELEAKIAAILKKLMARIEGGDFEAVRAANRKQAMIPAEALVIDPVGTAPGVVVPGKPTVVVLPGPPRELQPMWRIAVQTPAVQKAIAGRTIYRQDTVRMFGLAGVRPGRDATRRRAAPARFRVPGDHHLLAARRARDSHPLRTRRRGRVQPTGRIAARAARAAHLFRRRLPGGRPGGTAADRSPDSDGGVLHRRTAGGTAHRAAGFVGLPRRRCWLLMPTRRKPSCSASMQR